VVFPPTPSLSPMASSNPSAPAAAPGPASPMLPNPNPNQIIEVDTAVDDENDSALGSSDESYTTSLASSVKHYSFLNGRRYHAYHAGTYMIPNDDAEQDRMDLCHHINLMTIDGLYRAPVPDDVRNVLDIGTGTGIWAIDFADNFPNAQIVGTDLSPIQPTWVPPNLKFEIDDAESEWPYSTKFDYIHARSLAGSIRDWKRLFRQVYDHLTPGGLFEIQEIEIDLKTDDHSFPENSFLERWVTQLHLAFEKSGRIINIAPDLKELVQEAGFEDVHDDVFKTPIGAWPKDPKQKDLGLYKREEMLDAVEPYSLAVFKNVLQWTDEEIQVMIAGTKSELKDKSIHTYSQNHFVYGRKPLA